MPLLSSSPPTIWSDLDHRIIQDGQGAVKKVTNIDAVVTSIHNILETLQGERVMLPTFASKLKSILFEPMNDELVTFISNEVKTVIERWDDRVSVTETKLYSEPDENFIDIEIWFRVKGYQEVFTTELRFSREQ
jgi:phage baseplate assembly protein W